MGIVIRLQSRLFSRSIRDKLPVYVFTENNALNNKSLICNKKLFSKASFSDYKAPRNRNLYKIDSVKPFKISRSKLDLFLRCSRCFYLDRKLGIGQPPGYPFLLNNAVDRLLKKEFDIYREIEEVHPLCLKNNVDAIPFKHVDIERWRNSLHAGVQYIVPTTNLMLYGGLDDVWIDKNTKELIVVDYKATSKTGKINLDADWQIGYKRQVEIYQWLLRKNGFAVSKVAYFVYCNGKTDVQSFGERLEFDISLISYHGDDSWVEQAVLDAYKCLQMVKIPDIEETCDYCRYWKGISQCMKS